MSKEKSADGNKLVYAMDRFDRIVLPVENGLAVIGFGAMCFIVLYGVICRFLLKIPNPYGEEISRYLMIFAVYFAVAIAARKKEHIRVDFLIKALPGKLGKGVDMLGGLISIGGYLLLGVLSNQMLLKTMMMKQKAPSLRIPLYFVYIALVVGFFLAVIHSIETFILDHCVESTASESGGEE